jgi:glycosyltransferase involved in cell wall biosynthesis
VIRLLYLVSHPIQYQAPLLRRIAHEPDLRLRVVFGSEDTARGYRDPGFGVDVAWDVPLLEGYDHVSRRDTVLDDEIAAADVVWVHGWQYGWQRRAVAIAAHRRVPVLMRGENWAGAAVEPPAPLSWLKWARLRRLFADCSGFLAIGSKNRDYYVEHGIAANRIFPMPYAVDNAFFAMRADAARSNRTAWRASQGIPDDSPVLLFAGKLTRRKRPDLLLEAWRRAAWPGGHRPVLMFAGDGDMRAELEAHAAGAVRFLGFRNQSELPAVYAAADLLIVPSEREPWGLVVNEAMACGTAVIASDAVGAAYDLIDASCGAVFRSGDAGDLARAMMAALPRAAELGSAARRRIAAWDFEADVRGLRAACASVLAAAGAP